MKPLQRKWWVKTIRERNYFGFRYWWFNYLVLFSSIFLFILFFWAHENRDENTCLKKTNLSRNIHEIEAALDHCCTCNLPPRIPEDTFAVDCPDRILVFQVCNSNKVIDDNFDVYLNNTKIGQLDLNTSDLVGSVFIATTDRSILIKEGDFICPLSNMKVYYFDPHIVNFGKNKLFLKNTQNNRHDNKGSIEIRNYLIDGKTLIKPCKVKNLDYSMLSGNDFSTSFNYTRCCEN